MNTLPSSFQRTLSSTFNRFFTSDKSSGIAPIICPLISLLLANSPIGHTFLSLWHFIFAGLTIEHWINDGLMAIFFMMIGIWLELKSELNNGELSDFRNALLPIIAALGGICLPALIHVSLHTGLPTRNGVGTPMATDIAFALGVPAQKAPFFSPLCLLVGRA